MIFNVWFVTIGLLLIGMALASTVLKRLPLTTSILYAGIGLIMGPIGFGMIDIHPVQHAAALERLTEFAVVVSLFTAGLKMRTPFRDSRWIPPVRLATLTMVVTVGAVTWLGTTLLSLPIGAAVLLGAVLAPTDPVLASDVQVEQATDRDRLRFSLTGEAGLNDGTAFPFVMLGLGLLGHHEIGERGWRWVAVDLLWAVPAGLLVGWISGIGVARLTLFLRTKYHHPAGLEDFLTLGLIALSYGISLLVYAYGFLAVFAAGLALRKVEMWQTGYDRDPNEVLEMDPQEQGQSAEGRRDPPPDATPAFMAHEMLGFSEQLERILEVTVVLLVGGMLVYADLSPRALLFVFIFFFLVRPIAVYSTFFGKGALPIHRPYVAWFGVRGIGSLYYLTYAIVHGFGGPVAHKVASITLVVIACSVLVHGVTVTPLMRRYSRKIGDPASTG